VFSKHGTHGVKNSVSWNKWQKTTKMAKKTPKRVPNPKVSTFFVDRDNFLPNCHNLDRIIAKRFFEIRIQHYARRIANEQQKKRTGSEGAASLQKVIVIQEIFLENTNYTNSIIICQL
jgi:hypothetical protein